MTTLLDCVEVQTGPDPERAVIWMHGLGADGHDFQPIVAELDLHGLPAIRFVFPHAERRPVTINQGMTMRAWYDIVQLDDGARSEDEAGIRHSEQQIHALIEREIERGIAAEHIVLAGFSQGSAMTLHTGLRYPQPLAGLIALSGYLPLADTLEAERHAANFRTPVFLAHGTDDPVVPFARAEATKEKIESLSYPVSWHTYSMQHSVCLPEVQDIAAYLRRILA